MIPGWATLQFKPLQQTTGDWQEALLYFGPERIPKGASSAQLTSAEQAQYAEFDWQLYGASNPEGMHGGESWLTDHFLQHGQFEYRLGTPRYAHDANRFTRQCTKLWSQLLVDEAGQARPCPRFAPLFNIYEPGSRDGLDAARLHFLTGRPRVPCADCDLHPLVPLAPFVRHNFDADRQLLQARPGRVMVTHNPGTRRRAGTRAGGRPQCRRAGGEFIALSIVKALREERGCTVSLILARGGELVEEFRRRKIPLDAVHLDIDYMDGYRDFTWNRETFPDPAGLTRDLKARGVRCSNVSACESKSGKEDGRVCLRLHTIFSFRRCACLVYEPMNLLLRRSGDSRKLREYGLLAVRSENGRPATT